MLRSCILIVLYVFTCSWEPINASEKISLNNLDTLIPNWIDAFTFNQLLADQLIIPADSLYTSTIYSQQVDSIFGPDGQLLAIRQPPAIWFEHSPTAFQKHIKDKPFVFCEVAFQKDIQQEKQLHFSLHIFEKNSIEKFGDISSSSPLLIYRIDGEPIILPLHKTRVNTQAKKGYITFEIITLVKRSDIQLIRQAEVDKVQISFTKGDLSFNIFNIDFFNQYFKQFQSWK